MGSKLCTHQGTRRRAAKSLASTENLCMSKQTLQEWRRLPHPLFLREPKLLFRSKSMLLMGESRTAALLTVEKLKIFQDRPAGLGLSIAAAGA